MHVYLNLGDPEEPNIKHGIGQAPCYIQSQEVKI